MGWYNQYCIKCREVFKSFGELTCTTCEALSQSPPPAADSPEEKTEDLFSRHNPNAAASTEYRNGYSAGYITAMAHNIEPAQAAEAPGSGNDEAAGIKKCIAALRALQDEYNHQRKWNSSGVTTFAPVELSDWLLVNVLRHERAKRKPPEEAEKEARELAEEYARSIVKTEAFSEKGQVTMGFPSWHARQRNCLRNGFLSGYAAGRASVKASPSQAAPQEEGISEETLANLRLDYEWPLVKELTTLRARAEKLVKALKTVLNQPFDGDWDSQALYVQDVLAEWRKPAQLGAEGEKRG